MNWWDKLNNGSRKYDALRGYVVYSFIVGAIFGFIMAR